MINTPSLLLIQDDLDDLSTILLGSNALANNLNRVHEVGEDSIVDGGQSAGTRALLFLRGVAAGGTLGLGKNATLGNEEDDTVRELLLKFTSQTVFAAMLATLFRFWVIASSEISHTAAEPCGKLGEEGQGRR